MRKASPVTKAARLSLIAAAALFPVLALAGVPSKAMSPVIPDNSHPADFGREWECNWGYFEEDGECQAIELPKNAVIDALGTGWECNWEYRKVEDRCLKIKIPEHGA